MSLRHKLSAFGNLFRRYWNVTAYYWKDRKKNDLPKLKAIEAEFMPAALALQTKPVSPTGRWTARFLLLLLILALLWSIFGHLDIVVIASGKTTPEGQPKSIASIEVAKVVAIHVTDGQQVKAGDLLLELDFSLIAPEGDKAKAEVQLAKANAARARAMLRSIAGSVKPALRSEDIVGLEADQLANARAHLESQWNEYMSKRTRVSGDIIRYKSTLPLLEQRAQDFKELVATGDVSNHSYLDREQARLENISLLRDAQNQLSVLDGEVRKSNSDLLNEAIKTIQVFEKDQVRAHAKSEQLKITSPIDGTVQQLTVHTVGGVVPAAQQLMQIVPIRPKIEFIASVENKDIGFIEEGQRAFVKFQAFDYTKFGGVEGKVAVISKNSIEEEKKGSFYLVTIELEKDSLNVGGDKVNLSSGLAAIAEIKTGNRRVIEYVLSPLVKYTKEVFRER